MENWIKFLQHNGINQVDSSIIREVEKTAQIYKTGRNHAFFIWLKNRAGLSLSEIKDNNFEWHDLLSWLSIGQRPDIDWFVYEFEDTDDWQIFKQLEEDAKKRMSEHNLIWFQILSDLIVNRYL